VLYENIKDIVNLLKVLYSKPLFMMDQLLLMINNSNTVYSNPVPVIIDCDPGIDDAVAIMLAASNPDFDIKAITTVSGNLQAQQCAENAIRILDMIGASEIPVVPGPSKPLVRPYPRDPFSHGTDGLAELGLPSPSRSCNSGYAPDVIVDLVRKYPNQIRIFALGPLTNLALAIMKEPDLPNLVLDVICIGGSFGFDAVGTARATGDNPASEWNIYVDPEAAQIVFDSGIKLTAIGLDVATHPDLELSVEHRRKLKNSGSKQAKFLLGVTSFVEKGGFGSYCGLIDSLAIATAINKEVINTTVVKVAVETQSVLSLGQTVVDHRENFAWSNINKLTVARTFDPDLFFDILLNGLTKA